MHALVQYIKIVINVLNQQIVNGVWVMEVAATWMLNVQLALVIIKLHPVLVLFTKIVLHVLLRIVVNGVKILVANRVQLQIVSLLLIVMVIVANKEM